ncbi:MAG: hypothetical protein AAGJ11_11655, partial [Bacteroidota bacterium]
TFHFPLSTFHFPLSTFHFPLSTFHFPLSTFHFPLSVLSPRSGSLVAKRHSPCSRGAAALSLPYTRAPRRRPAA